MSSPSRSKTPAPEDPHGLVRSCRRLYTAIDALDAFASERLGIARNDLRCLNLLENGAVSAKTIAMALDLTTGSVTALLDRLEKKGLITRRPHPEDRRGVLIEATPKVFTELAPIYRHFATGLVALAGSYKASEAKAAARHLADVAAACERATEELKG